jgi:hypothetical protein
MNAKGPHDIVVDRGAGGSKHEEAVTLLEVTGGDRLDAQTRAVSDDLHLAGSEPDLIAQCLGYHHASCLINGCPHATILPSRRWKRGQRRRRGPVSGRANGSP